MRKTIFGFMFAMILGTVMASCTGNGSATEVDAADSTVVDSAVVVADTLVADSLAQVVEVADSVE